MKRGTPGTTWNAPRVPGLRLRHLETKSVWYLFYRTRAGRQRNHRLGDLAVMPATVAREQAKAAVATGADPAAEKHALAGRPTISKLSDWHVQRHCATKLKPRAAQEARRVWDRSRVGTDHHAVRISDDERRRCHRRVGWRTGSCIDGVAVDRASGVIYACNIGVTPWNATKNLNLF